MKFCQAHWDQLRKSIKDVGMEHLAAKDGKAAVTMMKNELENKGKKQDNFDPLMSAHWKILNNAIENGGLYLLQGEYCPLCELQKYGGKPNEWIEFATRDVLAEARKLGMMPNVQ